MADPRSPLQHFVAVPFPTPGHLNPIMRFCMLLAKLDGVIVTFVDYEPLHHRLQQLHSGGAADDTAAAADSLHSSPPLVRRACIPVEGIDISHGFNVSFHQFYESLPAIAPHLEQLILSLSPPVTCVLSDFNLSYPIQDVADKLGIPRVAIYPCSASRLLFLHYLSEEKLISLESVQKTVACIEYPPKPFCKLPGLPDLYDSDIPHFNHITDETVPLWKSSMKSLEICKARAHAMVINTFQALEPSTLKILSESCNFPVYDVGLWTETLQNETATSLWKEDDACISWLDQQPISSVLYISFGSITLLSRAQYEEFLHGLLSSQQRFLWVIRSGLVQDMDHSSTVEYLNSNSHGRGIAISWAPQLQVLAHPSVGGFVTHCGWNSTSESIAQGVPMLCWPYFAEQPLNARYIAEEWKVGLRLVSSNKDTRLIKRDEIEKAIRDLMEGSEGKLLRENAKKLQDSSRQCFLENGSSDANLKALIKSLQA